MGLRRLDDVAAEPHADRHRVAGRVREDEVLLHPFVPLRLHLLVDPRRFLGRHAHRGDDVQLDGAFVGNSERGLDLKRVLAGDPLHDGPPDANRDDDQEQRKDLPFMAHYPSAF